MFPYTTHTGGFCYAVQNYVHYVFKWQHKQQVMECRDKQTHREKEKGGLAQGEVKLPKSNGKKMTLNSCFTYLLAFQIPWPHHKYKNQLMCIHSTAQTLHKRGPTILGHYTQTSLFSLLINFHMNCNHTTVNSSK